MSRKLEENMIGRGWTPMHADWLSLRFIRVNLRPSAANHAAKFRMNRWCETGSSARKQMVHQSADAGVYRLKSFLPWVGGKRPGTTKRYHAVLAS